MKRNISQFTALAEYYDMLDGSDMKKYAEHVDRAIRRYGTSASPLMLDLACGTGSLTRELSRRGYDMIGVDISCDMLNVAARRSAEQAGSILYLLQDMRSFELYGSVNTVVCANDGINYLLSEDDLMHCLGRVHNYLDPGGLFLFDVNTPWRFREVFAKRDFFSDDGKGEVYMGWRSAFSEQSGICDLFITLFIKNSEGAYERREEHQQERLWTMDELTAHIARAGLELVTVHRDLDGNPATQAPGEEKWHFVCQRPAS